MNSPRFNWDAKSYPLLTWTSTMDCWSWSLPAGKAGSCPMENLAPNSICNSCYAQQGRYRFPVVSAAQRARFEYLRSDPIGCLTQIGDFINDNALPYFRVHDSGDFHSAKIIHLWRRVAIAAPRTHFWFPTRAWTFPHWIADLVHLNTLPNVTVRPSAQHFGDEPPYIEGLSAGTMSMQGSLPGVIDCPKSVNHTTCGTEKCRTCWSKHNYVNYQPHGNLVRRVPLTIGATA